MQSKFCPPNKPHHILIHLLFYRFSVDYYFYFIQFALQFYFLLPSFLEKYRGQALTFYDCNFILVHKCIYLSIFRLLLSPAEKNMLWRLIKAFVAGKLLWAWFCFPVFLKFHFSKRLKVSICGRFMGRVK